MRIATARIGNSTSAVRIDEDRAVEIAGAVDAGLLLRDTDWFERAAAASGTVHACDDLQLAAVVPRPGKILCVGLNYRSHILEMGREIPAHPTVFAKFSETLTGPHDDIAAIPDDPAMDWEGELAVVIGRRARRVAEKDAGAYIAGYTVADDISLRTWQNRTTQWLQGKMWAATTPVGPWLVTADAFDLRSAAIRTRVNGRIVQEAPLDDLAFGPRALVAYLSTIVPLEPGDLVLTGTPGGVGHARRPPEYLAPGDTVEVEVDGIGVLRNRIVRS